MGQQEKVKIRIAEDVGKTGEGLFPAVKRHSKEWNNIE